MINNSYFKKPYYKPEVLLKKVNCTGMPQLNDMVILSLVEHKKQNST